MRLHACELLARRGARRRCHADGAVDALRGHGGHHGRRHPQLRAALRAAAGDVLHAGARDGHDRQDGGGQEGLGGDARRARARAREDHQERARLEGECAPVLQLRRRDRDRRGVHQDGRGDGGPDGRGPPCGVGAAHHRLDARTDRVRPVAYARLRPGHDRPHAVHRHQAAHLGDDRARLHGLMRRLARRRPRASGTLVMLVAGLVVVASAVSGRSPSSETTAATGRRLREPLTPAFTVGRPARLSGTRFTAKWAPVRRPAAARAAPSSGARVVATLATRTPEDTRNVVAVIGHRQDGSGAAWVEVRLATLPNGSTGWVRRTALGGYGTVDTRLVVDLERLRATLYRDGRPLMTVAVGAGAPGWPTPRGEFYIRDKLTRYRSATYGPIAFGTSARSTRATDWPAGGYVGIHGTDRPDLLPGRVSHGCLRIRNSDIVAMAPHLSVGTPITIR